MKNKTILKLFKKAIAVGEELTFVEVNQLAVKLGYLVHPELCNYQVFDWLKEQQMNPQTTFYKKWSSVISKNRFELYIDQMMHYCSTYGTNYTGKPYEPEVLTEEMPEIQELRVINLITKEEVIQRCMKMLSSGIALKQETINDIIEILNDLEYEINPDSVRNKEAKMYICKQLNVLPSDTVEMVRYLVYLCTGKTLLIKDRMSILTVKSSKIDVYSLIYLFGINKLSQVFYRFKPLFLAMRNTKGNKVCINKLRRLAVTNHLPMVVGYFENLLLEQRDLSDLEQRLQGVSNFKKINLLQTINIRMKSLKERVFVIRNQKMFITQETVKWDYNYLGTVYQIVLNSLIDSLKVKACTVQLPEGVHITLPVSEKSFIGNYPLGTSFDLSNSDSIVGINWKGENGAQDLDLKFIDIDGQVYGWNVQYYNHSRSVVYSGDQTSANPEATELFYAGNGFKPGIIKVNLYNGEANSKFKFFIAKENLNIVDHGYRRSSNVMVDPNNILFTIDCEMDAQEKCLGVITEDKFVLAHFKTGKGRVAYNSVTDLYTEYAIKTLDCYLNLEDVLKLAGFKFVDSNPELDLVHLDKDTLIDLLS